MTTTCDTCGADNDPHARFCAACGVAQPVPLAANTGTPTGWDIALSSTPPVAPARGSLAPDAPFNRLDHAGWWARFWAATIDSIILLAIEAAALGVFLVLYVPDHSGGWRNIRDDVWGGSGHAIFLGFSAWTIATALFELAWDVAWTSSRVQGKPGQRACGFRVTDVAGRRLGIGRAAGRGAAKFVGLVPVIGRYAGLASAVTIGLTPRKQAVHDLIAGTACITGDALQARALGPMVERPAGAGGPFR